VVGKHLDDSGCLRAAFLVRVQMYGWDGAGQHHARGCQRLAAFVIEQCIDVGDEFLDPGVELEAFTQAKYEAAGHCVPFGRSLHFSQAKGAYPDVRCPCDCIGCVQLLVGWRRSRVALSVDLHLRNVEQRPLCLLSISVIFDSIGPICSTNQQLWPL